MFLFVPALAAGVLAEQAARVLSPIVTAARAVAVVAQPRLASEAGHAADANAASSLAAEASAASLGLLAARPRGRERHLSAFRHAKERSVRPSEG